MSSRKWLVVALVACGLACACNDFNTNLTTQTTSSTVTFVSPATATAGAAGFPITVNGTGFVAGAIILWNAGLANQVQLTTTFVSATQLTAPVPASYVTNVGSVPVAVDIPGSATTGTSSTTATTTTEVSNVVLFTIKSPAGAAPTISSLSASTTSQASTTACSTSGFTLTVTGDNFTSDAIVNWNGSARTTTFLSATQLTAAILPTDIAFAGTATVSVLNSLGPSSTLSFTVVTPTSPLPVPTVSSLSQTTSPVGTPAFTLTVTGTNILPCSVVRWINGSNVTSTLTTTYLNGTLNAVLPAVDFQSTGSAQVVVFTLAPGGGTSNASTFTIVPPAITSLSSSVTSSNSAPACGTTSFTLTVNGANFVNGSVVNWNGSPRVTTFVSSTQLTAVINAADSALPGTASVSVSNLTVNSNTLPFTTSAPGSALPNPAIATLLPTSATVGTGAFSLSVSGSNFVPCSAVQWNGTSRVTTYVSSTQLTAAITAPDVASAGTAQITVFNLTSGGGGGASGAVAFAIVAPTITSLSASTTSLPSTPYCSAVGLTLTVNGTGFASGLVVNWNGSPRATTFVNSTQLNATITAGDTAFPGTSTITVSNSTTTSNSLPFAMTTPTSPLLTPSITSLSPANANMGAAAFMLTVNDNSAGSLLPCSTVLWNGSSRTTTFVGTSGINAAISAADVANAGTVQVSVSTPTAAGGGGTSNALPFTIFDPPGPAVVRAATQARTASSSVESLGALSLPVTSSDQRYAVFVLASTDGATEIVGSTENIFVRDTCAAVSSGCTPSVTLASVGFNSNPADGNSVSPSISADGRYVTFVSSATNLVDSDTNGVADVFVRDTCAGAASGCAPSTQRVSIASDGTQANDASSLAVISANGRYVTFQSQATNLDPASYAASPSGIFLRDTCAGAGSPCTPSTQQLNPQN